MTSGRLITLLTDFGSRDTFVGVMKGVIAKIAPDARVIDLCHEVSPQNVREAAWLLGVSFGYFPEGTVHVAVVDPGVGGERRGIAVRAAGHVFVLPDNGLISCVLARHDPEQVVSLENEKYFLHPVSATFNGRDIFAPVAAHVAKGVPLAELGPEIGDPCLFELRRPAIATYPSGTVLEGEIVHVDHFGNLVTNFDREYLPDVPNLRIRVARRVINGLTPTYSEAITGELIALIGSFGQLEISIVNGNAAHKLRAKVGDEVTIEAG